LDGQENFPAIATTVRNGDSVPCHFRGNLGRKACDAGKNDKSTGKVFLLEKRVRAQSRSGMQRAAEFVAE